MIITVTLNPCLDKTLVASNLEPGQINRARLIQIDLGGKGINVSRALLGLGLNSLAMGFLGGATGDFMRRGLIALGVETDFVTVEGETRTNITIFDEALGLQTKINEAGPEPTETEIETLLDKVRGRATDSDLWIFAGNLPPGAPSDLYARLISIVKGRGGRACLDTSGPPLRLGSKVGPYLIKPNATEAGEVMGRELTSDKDMLEAVHFFLERDIEIVALSLGARGALIGTGQGIASARPPRVKVETPIGAGDSLLAGLVWAMENGLSLTEIARWAVASGTAAAMEKGTGVCTRAVVERLLGRIEVERL